MPRIRAALVLDSDTLRVEANSEKRMDRVLATLGRLDPAMNVLDDSRRPLRDARDAAGLAKQMPITGEDALDPTTPSWPRSSTSSSATTRPGGSMSPSRRSTATARGRPPTIPPDAPT